MSTKRGLQLDRVVLLGRTFEEYRRYFLLEPEKLAGKRLLDVAGGVSSFCAEANVQGIAITSVDPIYELSPEEIAARTGPDLEKVLRDIDGLSTYRWSFYKNTDYLRQLRERAATLFLSDYPANRGSRYISGALPNLPFESKSFDLTLVSYFLFVYEDQLSYEFHRDALLELMRVTREEVRIYPVVTFEGEMSSYIERLKNDPALVGLELEQITTDFEFLINSNSFLKVTNRAGT
jgi:hypothetical protein